MRPSKLTDKQAKFCSEYLIDFNATQAALRAGYAEKGVTVTASRLLVNVNVAAKLKQLMLKDAEKSYITKAWVLSELGKIYKSMREGKNETNRGAAAVALKSLEQICKLMGFNAEAEDGGKNIVALQINVKEPPKHE